MDVLVVNCGASDLARVLANLLDSRSTNAAFLAIYRSLTANAHRLSLSDADYFESKNLCFRSVC